MIDRFFNVDLKAGETLWTEGSPGDNFYVIKSGEATDLRSMSWVLAAY